MAGLSFGVSIIVGYPGESEYDYKDTVNFLIDNRDIIPKVEQLNPFTYYDGTPADRSADYRVNTTSMKRYKHLEKHRDKTEAKIYPIPD